MSKPKYTPGPWEYNNTYGLIEADSCGTEIAACHSGRGADAKANAHLISAAPDLLEAAIQALSVLQTRRPPDANSYQFAMDQLNKAIAKALAEK